MPAKLPAKPVAPSSKAVASSVKPVAADEPTILFQQYFKSVNPKRTYAAQVKEAKNGNHFLVLTEGKRDGESDPVRKSRLFVYSEDFLAFFRMLHETAQWIKANPVPESVKARRGTFWQNQNKKRPENGKTNR